MKIRISKLCILFHSLTFSCLCPGVLCVRLHAAGVPDPVNCHNLCDNCGDILSAECRELSLAVDIILLSCLNGALCVHLFHLLLPCEDQNVWILPDQFLLWVYSHVLSGPGHPLWWVLSPCPSPSPSPSLSIMLVCKISHTDRMHSSALCSFRSKYNIQTRSVHFFQAQIGKMPGF